MNLKEWVRDIPDFPIPGVLFRDIAPLLRDPKVFSEALKLLVKDFDLAEVDAFVGVESRGFILGAALASQYQKGFIPLRKAGKLPPPVIAETYDLEYGRATLEMQPGQGRVVIVDDVLATGGTLAASIRLCRDSGYDIKGVSVLIDLRFLNQFRFQDRPVSSALVYD